MISIVWRVNSETCSDSTHEGSGCLVFAATRRSEWIKSKRWCRGACWTLKRMIHFLYLWQAQVSDTVTMQILTGYLETLLACVCSRSGFPHCYNFWCARTVAVIKSLLMETVAAIAVDECVGTIVPSCCEREFHKDESRWESAWFVAVQDFEALQPNLLARTIETVEGGGLVVLLLSSLSSLSSLYTMTMVCATYFASLYLQL